jgi:hypothetical protein
VAQLHSSSKEAEVMIERIPKGKTPELDPEQFAKLPDEAILEMIEKERRSLKDAEKRLVANRRRVAQAQHIRAQALAAVETHGLPANVHDKYARRMIDEAYRREAGPAEQEIFVDEAMARAASEKIRAAELALSRKKGTTLH